MRPSLSRVSGLFLCLALAIAPDPAWATTVRTNLGQSQSTVTEVRWQPTPKTETVTGPWEIYGSTTWVKKSQPSPMLAKFQEYRREYYRQLSTTYPLEAKEQRVKTTTTQNYELKTYAEQSTSSTVMVPLAKEVREMVTRMVDQPVTTPIQEVRYVPTLVTVSQPIYKTVTSTKSAPILTPLEGRRTVTDYQTQTVTKYRTETKSSVQTVYYNGRATCGSQVGTVQVSANGTDFLIKGLAPFGSRGHLLTPPPEGVQVTKGAGFYTARSTGGDTSWVSWGCAVIPMASGRDIIQVTTGYSTQYASGATETGLDFGTITLDGKFQETKTLTTTSQVPYTETVSVPFTRTESVPFSIQLETLASTPADRAGYPLSTGVTWNHHHYPGISCPFQQVVMRYDFTTFTTDGSEVSAALKGPLVGNAGQRIAALGDEEKKAFTLGLHHTDVLPRYLDDVKVESSTQSVLDHYEYRQIWTTKPLIVTRQVPIKQVIAWTDRGRYYTYNHSHTDPTLRCDNRFLTTGGSPTYSGTVYHTREPVYGPLTEKVAVSEWATRSITVLEPRTVTSTYSVLVSTVPGQELSTSFSPWVPTGEQRRVGSGNAKEATRSVDIAGRAWAQDLSPVVGLDVAPLKAQPATFVSDRSAGGTRQAISGKVVREQLKASEVVASRTKKVQTSRGTLALTTDEAITEENDPSISLSDFGAPVTTQKDRIVFTTSSASQRPTWTPGRSGKWKKQKTKLKQQVVFYWKWVEN